MYGDVKLVADNGSMEKYLFFFASFASGRYGWFFKSPLFDRRVIKAFDGIDIYVLS